VTTSRREVVIVILIKTMINVIMNIITIISESSDMNQSRDRNKNTDEEVVVSEAAAVMGPSRSREREGRTI
jgi:hypothetical protein